MFSTLPPFQVSINSEEMAVRDALAKLMKGLGPLKLDVEEAGTVELVVAEALNNVVEHAYPEGQPSGPINIQCRHKSDGLHLTIIDQGLGMPEGKTPLGERVNVHVDLSHLPEGGFGWFLIRDLAKDVDYVRKGWENRLSLRLAVATSATHR
ncbi:MAG: ATP-binding protein [Pseudomonadota bacterium]